MGKVESRKVNFLLAENIYRQLEELAERESARFQLKVTVSDVVRRAIYDMLHDDEEQREVWKDA